MRKNKGFTLMELLLVVAIIGVLVGVAIPVFNTALEKSREAVCMANRRSLQSVVDTDYLVGNSTSMAKSFDNIYQGDAKAVYVCPDGGTFSWEGDETSGHVVCSVHDGTGSGGSGDSGGDSGGDSNAGTYLDTGLKISDDYWPTDPNLYDQYGNGKNNGPVLEPGGIFTVKDQDGYWVVYRKVVLSQKEWADAGPSSISQYASAKLTGTIVTFHDDEQKSDLVRGDLCKVGSDYYVFINGGTWAYSPQKEPNSWYKIPNS